MERRSRRTHWALSPAQSIWDERAAAELAIPRCAKTARTEPRRLHRELQYRAHGPGLPPGRDGCTACRRMAVQARLRSYRHPGNEPRVLLVAAGGRARAADH